MEAPSHPLRVQSCVTLRGRCSPRRDAAHHAVRTPQRKPAYISSPPIPGRSHARVAVAVDLAERSIAGVAELTLTPCGVKCDENSTWQLRLHCAEGRRSETLTGLTVESVTVEGESAPFDVDKTDHTPVAYSNGGADAVLKSLKDATTVSDSGALLITAPATCLRKTVRPTPTDPSSDHPRTIRSLFTSAPTGHSGNW